MVNKDGELKYFINGVDQGVAWTGVPTDKPMWGFADIYGLARKIKSEFLFGEFVLNNFVLFYYYYVFADEVMSCSEDSDLDITG